MPDTNTDIEKLDTLLNSKTKTICLLAPSFVADFEYPDLVFTLRTLGFDKVVELTFGAKMTNVTYYKYLRDDKTKTWIGSACPTLVELVRNKYPHLVPNLLPVHSPMGSMSLIAKKFYPDYKRVFVGPCVTKKNEAKEIGTIDLALTFKEIQEYIGSKKPDVANNRKTTFDRFYNDYTKIYPITGGLKDSLHYKKILKESEILAVDGVAEIIKVLDGFKDGWYKKYAFLELLSCKEGCVGGPGMAGNFPLASRRERVIKYRDFAQQQEKDLGRTGKIVHAEDIDFSRTY